MKTLFFILTIFWVMPVYGQAGKDINIPTYINHNHETDTTPWFKYTYKLAEQIQLKDLKKSIDTFHFRFWTHQQAIDLWTINNQNYFGMVTNYAQRYDGKLLRKNIIKVSKVYANQVILDSSKAKQLYLLIDRLSIVDIPSDDEIQGWRQGLDGVQFIIETSTPTRYHFKTYWTPKIFADTLEEAKRIQLFVDYLYEDLKIFDYYKRLKLPAGTYQSNGVPGINIRANDRIFPGAIKVTDLL